MRSFAGLSGLRLYDLRHSYASIAVTTGEELRTVAGLLGHTQVATTMGYAHLAQGPIKAAAGRVSNHLATAITPAEPVKPINAPRRTRPTRRRKAQQAATARRDARTIEAGLTEFERYWEPHVLAFRQGSLKLPEFCKQQGLDPTRLRIAVRKHYRREKARVGRAA